MKRIKGSKIGQEQKEWNATINEYPYAVAVICMGAASAIIATKRYM